MSNDEPTADIQRLANRWTLVTFGNEQISVDPAGLLMFPRHCTPEQVPDFIGALATAATVGAEIREQAATQQPTIPGLPANRMIITEGPPPQGSQIMKATIGRNKR